jgi:response regulator of citrate/malate metabolism
VIGVLVVDDDFMVARIHSGFVERTEGFRVLGVAHTGAEALESAATLRPDLVLLDVHLPDMSGLEVLAALRAAGSIAGVVMVTADRELEVVKAALRGGAMQYLVKPFHYDDLAHRLGRVRDALTALGTGEADQATIDRIFAVDARLGSPGLSALPKGLSQVTAELVLSSLRERGEQSAAECADALGLSRVTARRYLEHFVGTGSASVRLNYGGTGRPEHRYRSA